MKNPQENLATLNIWSRNVTASTREPTTRAWISADIWRQDGAICSKNRKIVPYHGSARIPRLTVSVSYYGSWFYLNIYEKRSKNVAEFGLKRKIERIWKITGIAVSCEQSSLPLPDFSRKIEGTSARKVVSPISSEFPRGIPFPCWTGVLWSFIKRRLKLAKHHAWPKKSYRLAWLTFTCHAINVFWNKRLFTKVNGETEN